MSTGISRESMSEQRATNDSNGGVPAHPTRLLASGIASPMAVALLLTACGGGGGGGNPVTTGTRRETQSDKLPVRPAETPVEEAPERLADDPSGEVQKDEQSSDARPGPDDAKQADSNNSNDKSPAGQSDTTRGETESTTTAGDTNTSPPARTSNRPRENQGQDPAGTSVPDKRSDDQPDQAQNDEQSGDAGPGPDDAKQADSKDSTDKSPADTQPHRKQEDDHNSGLLPPNFRNEEDLSWANIRSEDPFVDPIPRFPTSQRQPGNLISIRIEEGKTDLFPLIAQYGRSMPEIFAPELDVPGAFFEGPDAERFYLVHEPANEPEGSPERLVIRFLQPPDHEKPGDADGNNTYEFSLNDFLFLSWGNLSFRVTVDDVPDPVDDAPDPVDRQPDPVDPPPSPIVDDPDPFEHLTDPIIDLPDF
jgi:hypothetical protein